MKLNALQTTLKHYNHFFGYIDFNNMPERESEEYRKLLLKTANDTMFLRGRYTLTTEMTLELFDREDVKLQVHDLQAINALGKDERQRLSFYLDLKDMCYPLFRNQTVNWGEYPWNLSDGNNTIDNLELYSFITSGDYPCLSAAILYNLKEHIWNNEEFSPVARQQVADKFFYAVKHAWNEADKGEEQKRKLAAEVCDSAEQMWFVDNHIKVGKLLGFGIIEQSLYDAFDTFVDTIYRHKQVCCAKELGKYIREHIDMEAITHNGDMQIKLEKKISEVMDKYGVVSPSMDYTLNSIFYDTLKVPVF